MRTLPPLGPDRRRNSAWSVSFAKAGLLSWWPCSISVVSRRDASFQSRGRSLLILTHCEKLPRCFWQLKNSTLEREEWYGRFYGESIRARDYLVGRAVG